MCPLTLRLGVFTALLALGMTACSCVAECSGDTCTNASGSQNVYLAPGQNITSKNGKAMLKMQEDGNLVIYCIRSKPWRVVWHTATHGKIIRNGTVFQSDGNLVLYDYSRSAIYFSGSYNKGGVRLVMQNDANLVIYTNYGHAVWSSVTDGRCG